MLAERSAAKSKGETIEGYACPSPANFAETPDFTSIYKAWFYPVTGWVRAFGGAGSEIEDLAQEVFLVVQERLPSFTGGNLSGWLYNITAKVVSGHRRRSWFKHLYLRPREVELETIVDLRHTPIEEMERKDAERVLQKLLSKMSHKRRSAFVLFEIEGYSGEEIAALQNIPLATVWTRVHHARKEYLAHLQSFRQGEVS